MQFFESTNFIQANYFLQIEPIILALGKERQIATFKKPHNPREARNADI